MLAKLRTFALHGIDAIPVEVEVDSAHGTAKVILVGLAETAVRESVHRIERALANLGFYRPTGRVIISLAPADLRKEGGAFDLPIALGILVATQQLKANPKHAFAAVGELALDGTVRPVHGMLSMALAARDLGVNRLIVPAANAKEAAVVSELEVFGVTSLSEAVGLINGVVDLDPIAPSLEELTAKLNRIETDFADVRGQESAKRAMVVVAAGGHNVLMLGSPGSGKTMLAKRLPGILPPFTLEESLETTRIYSAVGRLKADEGLLTTRPVRTPHHTISDAGMVGGGTIPAPGEISLAHNGVLFLDELPEFNRKSLEALRQPLEEARVTISRAAQSTTFPADFILCAAMNPCPCGYLGDARTPCKCHPAQVERYLAKISGPLLDRIDLHVEVPAVPFVELSKTTDGTNSLQMRTQVDQARAIQAQRFGGQKMLNGRMPPKMIRTFCTLGDEARGLLNTAMSDLGLSARAHDRILRVARTIADLANSEMIEPEHIAEGIAYRTLDRQLWRK